MQVWELHEAAFGRNHVSTAAACISIGNLCVVAKDLQQSRQWFSAAIGIYDQCYSARCMQVTANAEVQLGRVNAKLGGHTEAAKHIERAAAFYLSAGLQADKDRRVLRERSKRQQQEAEKGVSNEEGPTASEVSAAYDPSLAARFSRKAHELWHEVGRLRAMAKDYDGACAAYEEALRALGGLQRKGQGSGGQPSPETSSEGNPEDEDPEDTRGAEALKLLMHSLKAYGSALEQASKWRRAASTFEQLRTLASRLLGPGHKVTQAAALRAKRASQQGIQDSHRSAMKERASPSHRATATSNATPVRNLTSAPTDAAAASFPMSSSAQRRQQAKPHAVDGGGGGGPVSPVRDMTGNESWLK